MSNAQNSFLGGFAQAFGNVMLQKQQQQRQNEMFNLQKKKLNADLQLKQAEIANKNLFMQGLTGDLPEDQAGPPGPGMSVQEALLDPGMQALGLRAGQFKVADIQKAQQQKTLMDMLAEQQGGAFGAGQLDPVSVISGDPKLIAPGLRKSTDETGAEIWQRFPPFSGPAQPVGAPQMAGAGGQPQPGQTMQGGLAKPSDMDLPIPTSEIQLWRNIEGEPPTPGTSPSEAAELGFTKRLPSEITFTPEQGGKLSAMVMGRDIVRDLETQMFDSAGNFMLGFQDLLAMNFPDAAGAASLLGADVNLRGRRMRFAFEDAIDAVIRARTGAAATEGEMNRLIGQFMPSTLDYKDQSIMKDKMNRLKNFLDGTIDISTLPDSKLLNEIKAKIKPEYSGIRPSREPARPADIPRKAVFLGIGVNNLPVYKMQSGELIEYEP